jgi:hypothetical protein
LEEEVMRYKFIGFKEPMRGSVFWLLEVKAIEELMGWYKDYISSYPGAVDRLKKGLHPHTMLEKIIYVGLMHRELYRIESGEDTDNISVSAGDILNWLSEGLFEMKAKYLVKYGVIHINESGAYFPTPYELYEAVDEKVSDTLEFPLSRITITKWFGGKHYYVGDEKFNTLKEAKEWVEELGIQDYEYREVVP